MLTIDDESGHMSSDATKHGAVSAGDGSDRWTVTWLPLQTLNRNAAVTAMSIADTVARCGGTPTGADAVLVAEWAAELDLTAERATEKAGRTLRD